MTWNDRFEPRGLEIPEELQRERRMLESLKGTPRGRRLTAVEILCGCDVGHLLVSVHPTSSPERLAVWQHGGTRTRAEDVTQVDDLLSGVADALNALRVAEPGRDEPPTWLKRGDTLSIRSLPLLRDGLTHLGSVVAPCLVRAALPPEVGRDIARAHSQWLDGGRRAPARLYVSRSC